MSATNSILWIWIVNYKYLRYLNKAGFCHHYFAIFYLKQISNAIKYSHNIFTTGKLSKSSKSPLNVKTGEKNWKNNLMTIPFHDHFCLGNCFLINHFKPFDTTFMALKICGAHSCYWLCLPVNSPFSTKSHLFNCF